MKKHFLCFKASKNTGLKYGRIDVVGVRDVGGSLSGEIETISIEVKRGTEAFATACGQALGYRIYANRVYLADIRTKGFIPEEISIANNLGLGLIQIKNKTCQEILSSPYYTPMKSFNLKLLETLTLGQCKMCNSFFEIGNMEKKHSRFANLSREDLKKAVKDKKGMIFWNYEVADRKYDVGIESVPDDSTRERRFICRECIEIFFSKSFEK